jgi:predicted ATP-binding protein involved in virulence
MIRHVSVTNLNGRFSFDLAFHPDINIITGRNGSGKTTLLKLVWYCLSGNIELAATEMSFDKARIETDRFFIELERVGKTQRPSLRLTSSLVENHFDFPATRPEVRAPRLEEINRSIAQNSGTTVFFPTFRRIEGGFSISETPEYYDTRMLRHRHAALQNAMSELSERLSNPPHQFVASISTNDISQLLTQQYAAVSEKTNRLHTQLAQFILDTVSQGSERKDEDANRLLKVIETRVNAITAEREQLLMPFAVLSSLVERVFQHKGIQVSRAISLGEAKDAIVSETLSAGEKQMLSFLCYNAFSQKACLFIDEPEISLHVDWQRQLFPTLLSQSSSNQFVVATHSPFIYSKYSDKELVLVEDRGGE